MKPIFIARKHLRPTAVHKERPYTSPGLPRVIFTQACQHLPGFHIVPRQTPREWNGLWFIIDY